MTLLNTSNADIALTLANITEALQELAANPDSPVAFLNEATLDVDQGHTEEEEFPFWRSGTLAVLVRENSQARRDAATWVAKRFAAKGQALLPVIASIPVCPTCDNRREIVIGIDPDDWTGGTELMGPCPACRKATLVDDRDPYEGVA